MTATDRTNELLARIELDLINQLNQRWYELNNAPKVENEDSRAVGIRIGQKNGLLKAIRIVQQYFENSNADRNA